MHTWLSVREQWELTLFTLSLCVCTHARVRACVRAFFPREFVFARQKYAKWSQRLNVEIYVAYAEANGHATEALGNIRTVKAMSTESQGNGPPRASGGGEDDMRSLQ